MTSSRARPIVIDDSDQAIRYTGEGWLSDNGSQDGVGNFGPTYLHTLHGTNVNGGLAYTFQGTSVHVFGTTKLAKTPAGTFDPSWECFVDKISIGATKPFEFPENNWILCETSDLADGQHEIAVNVNTAGQTFWFDNIQYTPSPNISLETAVVLVDNHDPGIVFDSQWRALGSTANMTQATGSTATFLFTGTSVSWVGFIPQELPHNASSATYSVDGGPPIFFPLKGLPPGPTSTVYNQIFFTTPQLPAGPHSLVVVHQGSGQQTPLTLDFLYVTNTSTPVSQSTSPNPNSTATGTTGTTGTSTSSSDKDSTPVGAIVGGVVGGLALIALALLLLLWYKRTQRHAESHHDFGPPNIPPSLEVSPFTYGSSPSRSGVPEMTYGTSTNPSFQNDLQPQRGVPVMAPYYPSSSSSAPSGVLGSQSTLPTSRHAPSASTSSGAVSGYNLGAITETREMRKPQEKPLQPVRHPVLHQDSGLRLGREAVMDDVPPTYTAD